MHKQTCKQTSEGLTLGQGAGLPHVDSSYHCVIKVCGQLLLLAKQDSRQKTKGHPMLSGKPVPPMDHPKPRRWPWRLAGTPG